MCLPSHLTQNINKYTAFEPNDSYATELEEWLPNISDAKSPFHCLEHPPDIRRTPFTLEACADDDLGHFNLVLFCHSMYGLSPKRDFIEKALNLLVEQPESGMVVVCHRDGTLHLDGLVCHRTASFPAGTVHVRDDKKALDRFASFIVGFAMEDSDMNETVQAEWRKTCRTWGDRTEAHPNHLQFSAPNIMAAFTRRATALPDLVAKVPFLTESEMIKSQEARLHQPASIIRPIEIGQVQEAVRWAVKNKVGLTIVGGGHSGHWPNVVSVDMGAFDKIHILAPNGEEKESPLDSRPLVVVEGGCKAGDIIRKTQEAGLTVPLGARPSVGAGLWLQGGIGHQARQHGLACDAIVGAVVVSVDSAEVWCVGHVPIQHQPAGSVRPNEEKDLLWALRGAGTNFGIVVSIIFKAFATRSHRIEEWSFPLSSIYEAIFLLVKFHHIIGHLDRQDSADAYLFWDNDKLHIGVTLFTSPPSDVAFSESSPTSTNWICNKLLGTPTSTKAVDDVGLFQSDMYLSGMHGGHGGGKTSSFKRCVFLNTTVYQDISEILIEAIEARPSPLCYLHLLQGRQAVSDVAAEETAFGCRDWDIACVITGVWPRDQYDSKIARATVQWV